MSCRFLSRKRRIPGVILRVTKDYQNLANKGLRSIGPVKHGRSRSSNP